MKVALVHDYLRDYGGAERVLEMLHKMYPSAPVFVAFVDKEKLGIHWQKFADWDIRESWLTKIPFYKKLYSPLRVFAPSYFQKFDLSEYDLVISSNNAYFSKAISAPNGVHICYCHTPPRSLYGYTTMTDWHKNWIFRVGGSLINHYLRIVDFEVAQKVDYFIANSKETQARIYKFYRRNSEVIYPPIKVSEKLPTGDVQREQEDYYLHVGRIAKSKHVDLAIEACNSLGVPLKVGAGKGNSYLESLAGPKTQLLGEVSDAELGRLYKNAKFLLFPAEDEDFGMVPVEAMGYGVPVIAHRSGGPLESIVEGKTGLFFNEFSSESLAKAIKKAQKIEWDRAKIHKHALEFGEKEFIQKIRTFVKAKNTRGVSGAEGTESV